VLPQLQAAGVEVVVVAVASPTKARDFIDAQVSLSMQTQSFWLSKMRSACITRCVLSPCSLFLNSFAHIATSGVSSIMKSERKEAIACDECKQCQPVSCVAKGWNTLAPFLFNMKCATQEELPANVFYCSRDLEAYKGMHCAALRSLMPVCSCVLYSCIYIYIYIYTYAYVDR